MISVEEAYRAARQLTSPVIEERQAAIATVNEWLEQRAREVFVREMRAVFAGPAAVDYPVAPSAPPSSKGPL